MKPSLIEVSPIKLPDAKRIIAEQGKALRRVAARAKSRAASEFKRFGIGRTLYSTTPASQIKNFKVGRLVEGQDSSLSVDVTVTGLPGLQETGGRTKAHVIHAEGKRARSFLAQNPGQGLGRGLRRLAFVGRGGLMRPFTVNHPGGLMRPRPVVEREIETALGELDREVEKILAEAL